MIHIAIIEDNPSDQQHLVSQLVRYRDEHKEEMKWVCYASGEKFLFANRKDFDLIFMDIELGGMNGIETARKIRTYDEEALIVLITNLMQYAIQGYSVRAVDYILKPVEYGMFEKKMEELCSQLQKRREYITVKTGRDYRKLPVGSTLYLEVFGHQLYLHTREEKEKIGGTLAQMEQMLSPYGFVKCNKCYLVNLEYVDGIVGDCVEVAGSLLKISRREKAGFIQELTKFARG